MSRAIMQAEIEAAQDRAEAELERVQPGETLQLAPALDAHAPTSVSDFEIDDDGSIAEIFAHCRTVA